MNTARSSPYKTDGSEDEGNRSAMRSPRYLEPIGHQKEVYPYSPSPNKRLERRKKHAFDSKVYWSSVNKKRTFSGDETRRVVSAAGDEEGRSEGEEYRSSKTSMSGGRLPSPRSSQRRAEQKDSVNVDDDEKRWLSHRFMEFYTNTSLVKGDAKYPQGPLISPRSAHGFYVHLPNANTFTGEPPRDEVVGGVSSPKSTAASEGCSPSSLLHIPSPPRLREATREAGDSGHRARKVTPSDTEIASAAGGSPRTEGENGLHSEGEGECRNKRTNSVDTTDGTNTSAVVEGNEADTEVPPPSAPASDAKVNLRAPHTPRKMRGRGELGGELSPIRITSSQSNAIPSPSSSTGTLTNQTCNQTTIKLVSPRVEEILRSLPSFDHSHAPPKPPPILEPKDPLQIIHGKGFELPPVKPTDTTRYKGKYRDGEPKKLGSSQPVGRVGEFR